MLKSINNILEKGFVFTRKQSDSKLARHIHEHYYVYIL